MSHSNESSSNKWQDRALVTLALGVTQKKIASVVPVSDDDLILFYQDNLGDERREQVIQAIANDDSTYQRWIDLVQTNELVSELMQQEAEVTPGTYNVKPENTRNNKNNISIESNKRSLVGQFRLWLLKDRDWTGDFGRRCAFALVAIMAVVLVPQMFQNQTVDELYVQYAMSGSDLLPEKSMSIPSGSESNTYSASQTELAKGIASGFKELAVENLPAEWETDPNRYSDTDINPNRGEYSPYALGRLVALSLIQCKLNTSKKYFKSAAPLFRKLAKQKGAFADKIVDSGSELDDVCDTSIALIKLV